MSNLNIVLINRFDYSRDSYENQKNSIFYEACTQSLLTLMRRENSIINFYLDYNLMKKHLTSFLLQRSVSQSSYLSDFMFVTKNPSAGNSCIFKQNR